MGAIVLAKVEQGVFEEKLLRRWLDQALTREDDRTLFWADRPRGHRSREGSSVRC